MLLVLTRHQNGTPDRALAASPRDDEGAVLPGFGRSYNGAALSVAGRTVNGMSPTQPIRMDCPDPEDVNTRIRHLMEQPPTPERTAEYQRLLWLWVTAKDRDMVTAA